MFMYIYVQVIVLSCLQERETNSSYTLFLCFYLNGRFIYLGTYLNGTCVVFLYRYFFSPILYTPYFTLNRTDHTKGNIHLSLSIPLHYLSLLSFFSDSTTYLLSDFINLFYLEDKLLIWLTLFFNSVCFLI